VGFLILKQLKLSFLRYTQSSSCVSCLLLNLFDYVSISGKITKQRVVILAISSLVYLGNVMCTFLNQIIDSEEGIHIEKQFAGSASCVPCHNDTYKSHIQTAHYMDSRPAAKEFIKGSFEEGKNKFIYNKWMYVKLENRGKKFFQAAYINEVESQVAAFDIVVGSGRKGQTYLSWDGEMLYQLPVSYFTLQNKWCNSPGYSKNYIRFDRIIPAQCLECHSTYAKVLEDKDDISTFDKSKMIFGIDCEKCHGPAADHVNFHKEHPNEKSAKYMINIKNLGRQQRLDACAICHSGFRKQVKQPFTFQTGDNLDEHSIADFTSSSAATLDVHGNQYGLLTVSKCFKASSMDCSSCHNTHVNEFNNTALFSQRCLNCHNQPNHNSLQLTARQETLLENNCIDCHMPMLPSKNIVLKVGDKDDMIPDTVRTHRIAIYPERTSKFIKDFK
jgi:hypothetical protein